jgi:pilus assembly protein CpaB
MDRRKMLLIFGGAWVSAAILTWFLYAASMAPRAEKTVAIQAAARDMQSGTRLQKGDLKTIRVLEAAVPKAAIVDEKQALDRPLLFPVGANQPIAAYMIGGTSGVEGLPSTIDIGKRAISVPINDTSGVSGLILPQAHVDVLFTRPGSAAEAVTTTILEDVVVVAVGRNTDAAGLSATSANAQNANRTPPQSATLLVTPEQAQKLELAKNQGRISLALRNPLDHTVASDRKSTTSKALYGAPLNTELRVQPPKVDPPKSMGKADPPLPSPPPPPKKIIDVFRGDKHSQESFPGDP